MINLLDKKITTKQYINHVGFNQIQQVVLFFENLNYQKNTEQRYERILERYLNKFYKHESSKVKTFLHRLYRRVNPAYNELYLRVDEHYSQYESVYEDLVKKHNEIINKSHFNLNNIPFISFTDIEKIRTQEGII